MSEADIEFSGLAAHQEARAGLLTAATGAAVALENFQGGTEENESGDGKLLRQFSKDVARLSTRIVDAVTLEAALASHLLPIPVDIGEHGESPGTAEILEKLATARLSSRARTGGLSAGVKFTCCCAP